MKICQLSSHAISIDSNLIQQDYAHRLSTLVHKGNTENGHVHTFYSPTRKSCKLDEGILSSCYFLCLQKTLLWRHNEHDCVSKHQPHDCLLGRSFRPRSKKTSKLRVTGLCAGNSPATGEFPPRKWPVTRKMFPFDDVIMNGHYFCWRVCMYQRHLSFFIWSKMQI